MKLKYQFVENPVADKIVAVAVGDDLAEFNGFIKMNETGHQIFSLLKNEISLEDLIAQMQKLYPEESLETITDCVNGFLEELKKAEVLA